MAEIDDEPTGWVYPLPTAVIRLTRLLAAGCVVGGFGLMFAIAHLHTLPGSAVLLLWIAPLAALIVGAGLLVYAFQTTAFIDGAIERQSLIRPSTVSKADIESYRIELRESLAGDWLSYEIQMRTGFHISVAIDPDDRDDFLEAWFEPIARSISANSVRNAEFVRGQAATSAAGPP